MLLCGIHILFCCQRLEGPDHPETGIPRLDYIINVTVLGSIVWICEFLLILQFCSLDEFSLRILICKFADLFVLQNFNGSLGSHHCNLGCRPGIIQVAA